MFCWDISVERVFDRCEKVEVETQRKMTETRSPVKFHRNSSPWRELRGGIYQNLSLKTF